MGITAQFVGLMFLLLLDACGGGGEATEFFPESTMQIRLNGLTIEIPEEWTDRTNYTFSGPSESERLLVSYSEYDGVMTSSELLGEVKQGFVDAYGDGVSFPREGAVTNGSTSLDYVAMTLSDEGDVLEFFTTFSVEQGLAILVAHRTLATKIDRAERQFSEIVASIQPFRADTAPTAPGLRQAGLIWLSVPGSFSSPEFYRFSDPDESMELAIHPGPAKYYIYGTLTDEADAGDERRALEFPTGAGFAGKAIQYLLDEDQTDSGEVRRIYRAFISDGTSSVDIRLAGTPDSEDLMKNAWKSLVQGIEFQP